MRSDFQINIVLSILQNKLYFWPIDYHFGIRMTAGVINALEYSSYAKQCSWYTVWKYRKK